MFEAVQLGPFLFRTHTLFLLLGIYLSTQLFFRLALTEGLQISHFGKQSLHYLAAFLLGGRFFAALSLYRVYLQDPFRFFVFWDGAFSFLGGCIGIVLVIFVLTWRQRSTLLQWFDALAPAVTLGLACDWFGRFLGAVSYGKPTDMPWGIVLNSIRVRYTVPIQPVQLYYALFFAALTVFLLSLRKREGRRAGSVTLTAILLGALATLFFESLRGDFAVIVFAKLSDFLFLTFLFASLGVIISLEKRLTQRASIINSTLVGLGTVAYLLARPWISIAAVEWRFSQFLAILAVLATVVYVVAHRWKYPHL